MSDLTNNISAPGSGEEVSDKNLKPKSKPAPEVRHPCIPSFGFQLPPVAPTKPAPAKLAQPKSSSKEAEAEEVNPMDMDKEPVKSAPEPAAVQIKVEAEESTAAAEAAEPVPVADKEDPWKPIDKAGMAAAATRARMLEIMPPTGHDLLDSDEEASTESSPESSQE